MRWWSSTSFFATDRPSLTRLTEALIRVTRAVSPICWSGEPLGADRSRRRTRRFPNGPGWGRTSLVSERFADLAQQLRIDLEGGVDRLLQLGGQDQELTVGGSLLAEAVQAGVPVSTVALGTERGEVTVEDPDSPGTFIDVAVPVDEAALSTIAEQTGGTFFSTSSAEELTAVYDGIGSAIGFETVAEDVSDRFIALALTLAALTSVLSLLWFQRLP